MRESLDGARHASGDVRRPVSVQTGVRAAGGHQLVVRASLDDASVVEDDDEVGAANRGQAVCDDERCSSCQQVTQPSLDPALGTDVDGGRRLVEDQDVRIGEQRAGERDELPLAQREPEATLSELRVVSLR